MRKGLAILACVAMLGVFAWRADRFARHASQTFDEGAHLVAGVSYWRTGDFRLNPEHPPLLKLLWAIPVALRSDVPFQPNADDWENRDHWRIADAFLYEGPVDHFELLLAARRVNLALGVLLVALIAWWAYRLWGLAAGILACALAAFDPNLAAFAALLSMDLGLTLFALAAGYAMWEYTANRSRIWFLFVGVAVGLTLAAKFSAVVSVAGLVAGLVAFAVAGGSLGPAGSLRSRLLTLPTPLVRMLLVAAAVVIVVYVGIHALDWPRGFKQQLVRGKQGDPHFFLDGEIASTGWWRYFPEVLAIKTPPGTILLAFLGLVSLQWARLDRRELGFLFVPAAVYFLAMLASGIDIGWRVILPAYPAILLLATRSATLLIQAPSPLGRVVVIGAFVSALLPPVLDMSEGPRELSYANNLLANRTTLHRRLGDSNLDWGQGLKSLKLELAARGDPVIYLSYAGTARPEAYGIRYERLPGWGQFHPAPADEIDPSRRLFVAVSVSNLQGTYLKDPTLYRWLIDRQPISRTDDSIWLYEITGDLDAISQVFRLQDLK